MDFLFFKAFWHQQPPGSEGRFESRVAFTNKVRKKDSILLFCYVANSYILCIYYVVSLLLCLIAQLVQLHVTQFTARGMKDPTGGPPTTQRPPEN